MLVDNVTLTIKAGKGGNGAVSFSRTGQTARGGPNGGNGGNGGDIYVQGSTNITDLREFRYKKVIKAEDGVPGKTKNLFGKNAPHITFLVPLGTSITEQETGKKWEITDTISKTLLVRGGIGGRGNYEFRTATDQAPHYAEKGGLGEEKSLTLDLRLIAEVGLAGLPSAGKSTLLAVLTNAKPKIGNYPFTTLEPTVGMFEGHPIADIPGIIDGASHGKGLGLSFLKHIEKTKALIHCVDISQDHPEQAYKTLRREFELYSPELLGKPELILLTKADLVSPEVIKRNLTVFTAINPNVVVYSHQDTKSIEIVKEHLLKMIGSIS